MYRILVVEDESALRMLYRGDLTEDGHEVATASNAQEALALIEAAPPDLVVLDIRMPGMDGLDAMSRILALHSKVAVVLNSAFSCYKENFLSWAADAYVVKSSDTSELRETVRRVLAGRERASA